MANFLDSIRAEWQRAADAIVVDGSDLAAEMDSNFAGHEQEASAKYQAMGEIQAKREKLIESQMKRRDGGRQDGEKPKLMSSFVNGWYSARSSCAAQGAGHRGHYVAADYGNFQNSGPVGPEMGG